MPTQAPIDTIEADIDNNVRKYIQDARDLYENGLDKIYAGLRAAKEVEPDLYADFMFSCLEAAVSSAYIEHEWKVCLYEAVIHYINAGQADQMKETRLYKALGDRYSSISNEVHGLETEQRREKEFKALNAQRLDILEALYELQAYRILYVLEYDKTKAKYILRRDVNISGLADRHVAAAEKSLDCMRKNGLPSKTSSLCPFLVKERSDIWTRFSDVLKDEGLRNSQKLLFRNVATWARRLSLTLMLDTRSACEYLATPSGGISATEKPSIIGAVEEKHVREWKINFRKIKPLYYDDKAKIALRLYWQWENETQSNA